MAETILLKPGDPVRHKTFTELTGRVKHYEFCRDGTISAIPYCIEWDDVDEAYTRLGAMFVYAGDWTVEFVEDPEPTQGETNYELSKRQAEDVAEAEKEYRREAR